MIRAHTSTVLLGMIVIALTIAVVRAHNEIDDLCGRVNVIDVRRPALDGYVLQLQVPQGIEDELAACRDRTESLRVTLETLIRVYPNWRRERLPDPPPGWAPWPELGSAREWEGKLLAPPQVH